MAVNLDPDLLSILVCPKCRSEFRVDDEASELVCTNGACALAYPVRDDIPVLLIDEARQTKDDAAKNEAPDHA